jgi:hypothetical protein
VRRTLEQALQDLRSQVRSWARKKDRPELKVFVYPPEWEAVMLARLSAFAERCAAEGEPIELEDVGVGFLRELESREGVIDQLSSLGRPELLHDLGWLASSYLKRAIARPLEDGLVCRLLTNTGSLGTFVSYSAVANELTGPGRAPAVVLTFPGDADERSFNLLGLRVDTDYRMPRI